MCLRTSLGFGGAPHVSTRNIETYLDPLSVPTTSLETHDNIDINIKRQSSNARGTARNNFSLGDSANKRKVETHRGRIIRKTRRIAMTCQRTSARNSTTHGHTFMVMLSIILASQITQSVAFVSSSASLSASTPLLFSPSRSKSWLQRSLIPSLSYSQRSHRTECHASSSTDLGTVPRKLDESASKNGTPAHDVLHRSSIFGSIHRIKMEGDSVLGSAGVPTFACLSLPNDEDASSINNNNDDSHKAMHDDTAQAQSSPQTTDVSECLHFCQPYRSQRARGLEGVLRQGPAFILDAVLTPAACEAIIDDCNRLGFGQYDQGKNHHGALQLLVSQPTADAVAQALAQHVDIEQVAERYREMETQGQAHDNHQPASQRNGAVRDVQFTYAGLNRRWRVYKYESSGDETFAPHIDAGFSPSGLSDDGTELIWDAAYNSNSDGEDANPNSSIVSRLTVLMYLNDDFVGGETNFYAPVASPSRSAPESSTGPSHPTPLIASVRPVAGSVLVFPQAVGEDKVEYARRHWPMHEGSPVVSGRPKYVVRSDVLFVTEHSGGNPPAAKSTSDGSDKESQTDERYLFQYDHLVRDTFMPQSSAMNSVFLNHAANLYNPHMGVENLGPLLYSWIRFTKRRRVVEIGGGYTSLWILQALRDNDDEMNRIRRLEKEGVCKLMDIQWTNPTVLERFDATPAGLLCVDNCEHQKETATGVGAVAKALGLDGYLFFQKADAFEMKLGDCTIDILWCDFGVGDRMNEFMRSNWSSVRPGGFLFCHSTLTNQNTRQWLEAMRSREDESVTGVPADEYVEVSLLEPHKRFQNSVSIFQKRRSGKHNDTYSEPINSKYA